MERSTTFAAFVCFVGLITVGPELVAQRLDRVQFGPRTIPFPADHVERVQKNLSVPGVTSATSSAVHNSLKGAEADAMSRYEDSALAQAGSAFDRGAYPEATIILRALNKEITQRLKRPTKEREQLSKTRQKARLLLSNTYIRQGLWSDAEKMLATIDKGPVDDYVMFLRGEAAVQSKRHKKAIQFFGAVVEMSDSPLVLRAQIAVAHSLFADQQYQAAEPALKDVIDSFPLYPRRFVAMYEYAQTLERLGKTDDAANAYQAVWFEFPFKKQGSDSRVAMERLEKLAIVPSDILTAREKFSRYRRLRINKHWDLVRALFTELKEDYASENGHSRFEHEIEFQLALNDYHSREFDQCMARLKGLLNAHKSGYRAGISKPLLHRYLSSIYGLRGDHTRGIAELDQMTNGLSARTRLEARAEFYEKHGRYDKAYDTYNKLFSGAQKRGWHYTWLKYKTGRLQDSYAGFRELAERSSGRNRARYLYWAGRSLERGGLNKEAKAVFSSVESAYGRTYYGIQSRNRLLDLEQRTSVYGAIGARSDALAGTADRVLDVLDDVAEKWTPQLEEVSARGLPKPAISEESLILADEGQVCLSEESQGYCVASNELPLYSPYAEADSQDDEDAVHSVDPEDDQKVVIKNDAKLPPKRVRFPKSKGSNRIQYPTQARIYWGGRLESDFEFAKMHRNEPPGVVPDTLRAYDEVAYDGGLARSHAEILDLFPELERTDYLFAARMLKAARTSMRVTAIEFRDLKKRAKPRVRPIALDRSRWGYQIDNRRSGRTGFWGYDSDEKAYPVPKSSQAKRDLLKRQQAIYDRRNQIEPLIVDAMKEVGDYFFVRKYTLGKGGWYREDPTGPARTMWMQAYPRAFPELVMRHAEKVGVNPYLLWSLMCVESSFNPDSISYADALGLLQVIPRTGLKTAILFEDDKFGPYDLLEPDIAIEHGAFYFDKLVEKFRGQETLAIPGYNGGPHRVGDWLEMRGADQPIDEFIEEIPFDQARGYVKKVLRFLALYLKTYEGIETVYVGQNLRTKYKAQPNF